MTTHIVCRECEFEALVKGAFRAEEQIETHENATGHRVEHEFIGVNATGRLVTDGGVTYTPLQEFAAELSGRLCLDAVAQEERGGAMIQASRNALADTEVSLEEDGFDTERYEGGGVYDHPTLLVYPRPGDLEPEDDLEPDGGREAVQVERDAVRLGGGDIVDGYRATFGDVEACGYTEEHALEELILTLAHTEVA